MSVTVIDETETETPAKKNKALKRRDKKGKVVDTVHAGGGITVDVVEAPKKVPTKKKKIKKAVPVKKTPKPDKTGHKTFRVGSEKLSLVATGDNRGTVGKLAKGVTVTATSIGSVRARSEVLTDVDGNPLSVSQILRAGGYHFGWGWDAGRKVCDKLGIPASDGCCKCQTQDGRGQKAGKDRLYGKVPKLTKEMREKLAKLAPAE